MPPAFGPPLGPLFSPVSLITEIVFTLVAVFFCYAIFSKTKESYELTKHEGIKYFRLAFLFFGLSYLVRLFDISLFVSRFAFDFFVPRDLFPLLFILPLGYFSTVAILYLLLSTVYKRVGEKDLVVALIHIVAVLLTVFSFLTRSHFLLLYAQSALLVLGIIFSYVYHDGKKSFGQIRMLYILASVLWLINLWFVERRAIFSIEMELLLKVVSVIVFILIYRRVSKWVT